MVIYWLLIVLTKILSSVSLNVTVSPCPEAECVSGEGVRLVCEVGGRRGAASVVVLRWVVRPGGGEEPEAGHQQDQEFLLVKLNVRGAEFWGNYTQRFGPAHFQLRHDNPGHAYSLLLSNVTPADGGRYSCRAQEVRKHRTRWRAIANATAHTLLRVHHAVNTTRADCIWRLFEDLYLCAAVLCSIGLVSILLFAVVITCQQLMRRTHPKDSYSLVKCPDSSSGETVTSVTSSTSSGGSRERVKVPLPLVSTGGSKGGVKVPLPLVSTGVNVSSARPHRKQKRHKHHPPDPPDAPPLLPAKAPRIQKPRRTKLLKAQPRRTAVVRADTHTHIHTLIHTHTHIHTHTYTHTHIYTHKHSHTHTHTHTHTHILYTHTHTFTHTHTRMHALLNSINHFLKIRCKYIHMHTHRETHTYRQTNTHYHHKHLIMFLIAQARP
ncbi:hypothetical protein ACEWY4_020859 [Coilia grayii]|uniref:Ig-like domain-containing protein n=1 Tax=Coilia grayii TaxID=363190 RepID=A0ABD1J8N8_9TELE